MFLSVNTYIYIYVYVFNVCLWLEAWYPIVRNFLLLIQYHAVCGGSLYCEIVFQIFFVQFLFVLSKCFIAYFMFIYLFYFN